MKTLIFLCVLSLFGNNTSEIEIPYRQLTWADFRGPVSLSEPLVAARSTCGLEMPITTSGEAHYFAIKAYFLPFKSFVRVKSPQNLRHEQTHFRIAQIEALECRAALARFQGSGTADSVQALAVYNLYFDKMSQRNDQFDSDCNHGQDPSAEQEWEIRISTELRTLEAHQKNVHGGNQ